jgi:hypothetical protein
LARSEQSNDFQLATELYVYAAETIGRTTALTPPVEELSCSHPLRGAVDTLGRISTHNDSGRHDV